MSMPPPPLVAFSMLFAMSPDFPHSKLKISSHKLLNYSKLIVTNPFSQTIVVPTIFLSFFAQKLNASILYENDYIEIWVQCKHTPPSNTFFFSLHSLQLMAIAFLSKKKKNLVDSSPKDWFNTNLYFDKPLWSLPLHTL